MDIDAIALEIVDIRVLLAAPQTCSRVRELDVNDVMPRLIQGQLQAVDRERMQPTSRSSVSTSKVQCSRSDPEPFSMISYTEKETSYYLDLI